MANELDKGSAKNSSTNDVESLVVGVLDNCVLWVPSPSELAGLAALIAGAITSTEIDFVGIELGVLTFEPSDTIFLNGDAETS